MIDGKGEIEERDDFHDTRRLIQSSLMTIVLDDDEL